MKSYKAVYAICLLLLFLCQNSNAAPLLAIAGNYLKLCDNLMIRFYKEPIPSTMNDFYRLLLTDVIKEIDGVRQIRAILLSRDQPTSVEPLQLYEKSIKQLLQSGAFTSPSRILVGEQSGGASVGADVLIAQSISKEKLKPSFKLEKELKDSLIKVWEAFKKNPAFVNLFTHYQMLDLYEQVMEQIENIASGSG